jgi:ABC-type glycerol-3-phosphate transport system substrate-binding protein
LILANASGETPDVAMGLGGGLVFNLASRNALYDMTQQPDFWQVASRFPPGSLVSYIFNDGVFGVPDQINFNALIYRRDVFEMLGLQPPDTWQDLIDMLPKLQRFGMDFFHPIATDAGFKGFGLTTPMIYQHGGQLYSPDGLTAAITSPEAIAGIRFLSSLFTYHALPVQVPSFFNSFRIATVPIGIVDATSYNLIRNGAPELEGLWALAPNPGTADADGNISRWFVTDAPANVIFNDSPFIDEAWQFISWWTSAPVQAQFANTMQTLYGRQFMWFSSNLEALAQNPINPDDLDVILEQVDWLRSVPFTPGFYQLERNLSNIWNTVVFDGTPPRNAVDAAMPAINREQVRKLRELGFADAAGNLIVDYTVRELDWLLDMLARYGDIR